MLVSFVPKNTYNQATNSDVIKMEVGAYPWTTRVNITVPVQPLEFQSALGAHYLSVMSLSSTLCVLVMYLGLS